MDWLISLCAWLGLAVVLIAAFIVRHEPQRPNAGRKPSRAAAEPWRRGSITPTLRNTEEFP